MSAGKGSKPRPVNKTIYNKNYDSINWGDKNKKNTLVNQNDSVSNKIN